MKKPHVPLLIILLAIVSAPLVHTQELKTTVNPDHLANTTQYGYSQAVVVSPNAPVIYVAGQVGISDNGLNELESQVDWSFDNSIAVIETAGGRVENVVKITLLVRDMDAQKLQFLVAKRRAVFGERPPASTLIPVPELALPSLDFEIDAIAIVNRSAFNDQS